MTDVVYQRLVDLCEDICRRNGKNRLIWISDKNTALNYNPKSNEMLLTVHRWFANKSCPGDWLFSRLGSLAAEVTSRLGGSSKPVQPQKPSQTPHKSVDTVAREVIKGLWGNGSDRKSRLESAGYDYVAGSESCKRNSERFCKTRTTSETSLETDFTNRKRGYQRRLGEWF